MNRTFAEWRKPMAFSRIVGDNLTLAAEGAGISQEEVTRRLNKIGIAVSPETVAHYFNGRTKQKADVMAGIAEVLDVSIDLLGRSTVPGDGLSFDEWLLIRAFRKAQAEYGLTVAEAIAMLKAPHAN